MRLRLIAFGKLKTPGLRPAADYFLKLLQPWVQTQEEELKPVSVPDKSPATRLKIQDKEQELLLSRAMPKNPGQAGRAPIYLLDETGKVLSTEGWARLAREWESQGLTDVVLCIGSSMGFSAELKKQARGILSLGPQTLSHELARVVLLEQLYRAWSVIRGHPYHNAE